MQIEPDTMIARDSRAIETTVGSETILMMIQTGECIGLGDIGSEVWRQLAAPASPATLVQRLRERYDAPEGVVERDVHQFLQTLKAHNLIVVE